MRGIGVHVLPPTFHVALEVTFPPVGLRTHLLNEGWSLRAIPTQICSLCGQRGTCPKAVGSFLPFGFLESPAAPGHVMTQNTWLFLHALPKTACRYSRTVFSFLKAYNFHTVWRESPGAGVTLP